MYSPDGERYAVHSSQSMDKYLPPKIAYKIILQNTFYSQEKKKIENQCGLAIDAIVEKLGLWYGATIIIL